MNDTILLTCIAGSFCLLVVSDSDLVVIASAAPTKIPPIKKITQNHKMKTINKMHSEALSIKMHLNIKHLAQRWNHLIILWQAHLFMYPADSLIFVQLRIVHKSNIQPLLAFGLYKLRWCWISFFGLGVQASRQHKVSVFKTQQPTVLHVIPLRHWEWKHLS